MTYPFLTSTKEELRKYTISAQVSTRLEMKKLLQLIRLEIKNQNIDS